MEHSKHSTNSLFFLLIFGGRTGIWFRMCHEYLQACFSMHGHVNGSHVYLCLSIYERVTINECLSVLLWVHSARYKDVYMIWCSEKL